MESNTYWNYRVVKNGEIYGIREVYYEDGEPFAYTTNNIEPMGESLDELAEDLKGMLKALTLEILEDGKIIKEELDKD